MADIFCDSADMLSELNAELNHSVFMGGIVRLNLEFILRQLLELIGC